MKLTIESGLHSQYLRISDPEYHYAFGYYSNNSWVDDHRVVLYRFKSPNPAKVAETDPESISLVLVDLENRTKTVLPGTNCGHWDNFIVYGTRLYYIIDSSILYCMDVDSGEVKEICRGKRMYFPHMTSDGKYLNWHQLGTEDEPDTGIRVDVETGEMVTMFSKRFAPPFTTANHMMLCPTDPDLMFFAHEGNTFYVSNRLWLAPLGKEPFNIAKQYLNASGDLGDCFGHECWAADGKGLYFVKYICSPEGPTGLCYVSLDNPTESTLLYSKYNYWHVSVAPDGRHLAADTQDGSYSGVCLVDMETGTEEMLAKARVNWVHPCHPHPHFNPSSTKLAFQELDDNGQIVVGIFDI
jgi:Tol biopolymer transport system component